MNIMSTLSEQEVDKGSGDFNEEDETTGEEGSVGSGEHKVIVRMRDKKCLSRPQSDETSRVRCETDSQFLGFYLGSYFRIRTDFQLPFPHD